MDFARDVAPILSEHCLQCHNPGNRKGDFSLATVEDLNDHEYLGPGDPDNSYLLEVISPLAGQRAEMPKDAPPLTPEQVKVIRDWIAQGADWPETLELHETSKADANWWSLRPIAEPQYDSIDAYVESRLAQEKLSMNAEADRRTLIQRATYDLIGLPPTPDEVAKFEADEDPQAYERLIDRLLASPHYGERWGRHWLDVVRFGESNGFERNVIISNVWPFRDYVIRSLNTDKPIDQFIREHIAGDVLDRDNPDVAIGSAFLVAGPYDDVGNSDPVQAAIIRANTIDEMIRATSEAFLGLTIGCARCHDHKFDPILASDYYALYSIFAGVRHGSATLATTEQQRSRRAALEPLQAQRNATQTAINDLKSAILARGKENLAHCQAMWTRPPVDRRGTEESFDPVQARFVRLWCDAQDTNLRAKSGFRIDEMEVWTAATTTNPPRNVALATNGSVATGAARHIEDFADAYSPKLAIDGRLGARFIAAGRDLTIELPQVETIDRVTFSSARNADKPEQGKFTFVAEYKIEVSLDGEMWREVASGRDRQPTTLAGNPSHLEYRLSLRETTPGEQQQLNDWQRELREIDRQIAQIPALPTAWIGRRSDQDAKGPFHVFLGGDPQKQGKPVVPASLQVLKQPNDPQASFALPSDAAEAERRLALANWIADSGNPLTLRVLANRVWHYHFGTGIVDTPNDLGYMGGRPSHPELLDYLAHKLREYQWKLKPLHREIMLSRTYRQSSEFSDDAAKLDGDSRFLWRFPPRRLSAEEIRDTLLLVAGKIKTQMIDDSDPNASIASDGGPGFRLYHFMQDNVSTYAPLDQHGPETYRRAVYHQNVRASVVDLMTDFDQPDCAMSTARRASTTTPLQALTMMNHRFTLDMAEGLAQRVQQEQPDSVRSQIQQAYAHCFRRNATEQELATGIQFVELYGLDAFCRVLFNTSEMIYVR